MVLSAKPHTLMRKEFIMKKNEIIIGSGEIPDTVICLAMLTGNPLYQRLESYFQCKSASILQCYHLDHVSQLGL